MASCLLREEADAGTPELPIDVRMVPAAFGNPALLVTGTPDGGADGTWYATLQPGCSARITYLFSELPA